MANLNKVILIGRLTRDPETRTVGSGNAVVSFGLAVNRTYTRRDSGERVEETTFVDVEAWGRTGETIARYMNKGRQLLVEGRLKFDQWEKNGERRSKLSVVCETFQFMNDRGGDRDGGGGGYRRESAPAASVGARDAGSNYDNDDDIPF